MRQYSFNEEKIIDFIFENKNSNKNIDNSFFYENKIKTKRVYNEYEGPMDKIKNAGDALAAAGANTLKNMAKAAAKNLVSFGAFKVICKQIAKALNKDLATKKAALIQIKARYNDSMDVTRFFLKAKKTMYPILLMRGYKEFYSWELAMACIIIYESEGISEIWNNVRSFNINSLQKITEFKEKIDSGQLTNLDGTIKDSNKSSGTDKTKTGSETETETEETESPEETKKIIDMIDLTSKKNIEEIKSYLETQIFKKLSDSQKNILSPIQRIIKSISYGDIKKVPLNVLTQALKIQAETGISFGVANTTDAYKVDDKIIFNIKGGYLELKDPRPAVVTEVDLSKLKGSSFSVNTNPAKLKLSLLLIYSEIKSDSSSSSSSLSFIKEIIKKYK